MDLLTKSLEKDPKKRITINEILVIFFSLFKNILET